MFGLQQGNSVLKQLHSEMSLEDVEKLMGETADAVAYQNVSGLDHQAICYPQIPDEDMTHAIGN